MTVHTQEHLCTRNNLNGDRNYVTRTSKSTEMQSSNEILIAVQTSLARIELIWHAGSERADKLPSSA